MSSTISRHPCQYLSEVLAPQHASLSVAHVSRGALKGGPAAESVARLPLISAGWAPEAPVPGLEQNPDMAPERHTWRSRRYCDDQRYRRISFGDSTSDRKRARFESVQTA